MDQSPELTPDGVRSQVATIGADEIRIIADLDELQDRGMTTGAPDPDDRRVRRVSITATGSAARDRARAEIQQREELMLTQVPGAMSVHSHG